MKLRIGSDWHLEWRLPTTVHPDETLPKVLADILPEDERDFESVLVLAGDISSYPSQRQALLRLVAPRFAHVFYIPGNHEFYGSDTMLWDVERDLILKTYGSKVTIGKVGYSVVYEHEGNVLIGATLWAMFGTEHPAIESRLQTFTDCMHIRHNGEAFTPRAIAEVHKSELDSIKFQLNHYKDKKPVVVTHHLPSFSLCDPRFGNGPTDHAFASNQNALLSDPELSPKLWIHGHTHTAIERFLGETIIYCNPCGYPREPNTGYNRHKFIDI